MTLRVCPRCHFHVRVEETACPFCGVGWGAADAAPRDLGVIMAEPPDASDDVIRDAAPLYGGPPPPRPPTDAGRNKLLLAGAAALVVMVALIYQLMIR